MSEKIETGVYYKWKEGQRDAVWEWWKLLQNRKLSVQRAHRARLRRCHSPDQVMLERGFHELLRDYVSWPAYQIRGVAMVAGLLAHAKESDSPKGELFGRQLARSKKGSDTPVLSELRFNQLQKARQPEDIYRLLRRIILLLDREVNVLSLAEFILAWDLDYSFKNHHPDDPSKSLHFKLASNYYLKK
ncbi:MAG: type I-E CRISPR-associated protein Cse2/CasB [Desulfobacteraceae bacterium]|nr:type I-E CRISPR-associated protein Cse2/CasB [Desulfobacteraceae bacterium]